MNHYSKVITDDSYFKEVYDEIEQEEAAKTTKYVNKQKKTKSKSASRKKNKKDDEDGAEVLEEDDYMSETDDDDKENALFPQDWKSAITYSKSTWEAMAPPVPKQGLQDDW